MIGGEGMRVSGDRRSPLLAIELGTTLTHQRQLIRNYLIGVACTFILSGIDRYALLTLRVPKADAGFAALKRPLA